MNFSELTLNKIWKITKTIIFHLNSIYLFMLNYFKIKKKSKLLRFNQIKKLCKINPYLYILKNLLYLPNFH